MRVGEILSLDERLLVNELDNDGVEETESALPRLRSEDDL